MVRLLSLSARNFKKLRFDSPLIFSDGITLIAGLNESGKSSVLDAILYALFGRVTRPLRARNEDLISYKANEATVSLDFEIGDRRFRVTRRLYRSKPTRATLDEITTKGLSRPIAPGQEKVNDEIVTLLGGITYHEIISSTVVAQKELDKLIELDKDDRRKIINAFLNLDSFNTVLTDLSEERKDLEGTGARIGRVQAEAEKLALLKQELAEFNRSAEEKSSLQKQSIALTEGLKTLQTEYEKQDSLCKSLASYDAAARTRESLNLQLASKKQIYSDHFARSERLRKEMESIELDLSKFADHDKAESMLEKVRTQLEAARALSLELTTADRSRRMTQTAVGAFQAKLSSYGDVKLRSQAEHAQKPIWPFLVASTLLLIGGFASFIAGVLLLSLSLIAGGLIGLGIVAVRAHTATSIVKQQTILGDLRYLDEKRQELAGAEARHLQAKGKLDLAEEELGSLCKSIHGYVEIFNASQSLGTLRAAEALLEAAQKDRRRKDELQVKARTIRDEIDKLPPESEMVRLQSEIRDMERKVSEIALPELPTGIVFSPELLSESLTRRDEIGRQIATAQNKMEQNKQRIDDLERYLSEHAGVVFKVQSQEETVRAFEHKLKVVRRAVEGIQVTAEALRARIRPSVQGHMASILPALTSSRYRAAILDENYGLQVWDPEAGEYKPRDVYSGGTEDQFLLAMRLAFALALLPEVKGQKPEFVFLDEPLGSSDDVRRSGIVEYLASDLSKKFKQIFVISHVGGLEEYAQNTITLDDGRVV